MISGRASENRRHESAVVCDDDPMVRRIVVAVLERCGYTAIEGTALASRRSSWRRRCSPASSCSTCRSTRKAASTPSGPAAGRAGVAHRRLSGAEAMKHHARAAGADVVVDKVGPANLENLEAGIRSLPGA